MNGQRKCGRYQHLGTPQSFRGAPLRPRLSTREALPLPPPVLEAFLVATTPSALLLRADPVPVETERDPVKLNIFLMSGLVFLYTNLLSSSFLLSRSESVMRQSVLWLMQHCGCVF